MKVNIGPHPNWFGPYQLAEKIVFWDQDLAYKLGDWLAETWIGSFLTWVYSKRKRKVVVKLDPYDAWNVDHTLALIAHPLLVRLKENKHSFGFVDDEDVPEELKSTNAPPKEDQWSHDNNAEKRYEWVLNEVIYSFAELISDEGESKFFDHSGVDEKAELMDQIHQIKVDREGLKAYQDRVQNGFRLFGKYYRTFWD